MRAPGLCEHRVDPHGVIALPTVGEGEEVAGGPDGRHDVEPRQRGGEGEATGEAEEQVRGDHRRPGGAAETRTAGGEGGEEEGEGVTRVRGEGVEERLKREQQVGR